MAEPTFLPSHTFPANILRTLVSINAVIAVGTSVGNLEGTTKLLLAIKPQCCELGFRKNVVMRILAIQFGAFHWVEIIHVASPWREIFHRKPQVYD